MRFWDASAVVCLLVDQNGTDRMSSLSKDGTGLWVWWGTRVEAMSALCRLEREGALTAESFPIALAKLEELAATWIEVEPSATLKETALRLLRVHPLKAGDVLQLAAAHFTAEQRPSTLEFVCLDKRLATAASKEGFPIVDA